jgi:hypothetical protein
MSTSMQITRPAILSRGIENAIDRQSQLCDSRMSVEFWRDTSSNQSGLIISKGVFGGM